MVFYDFISLYIFNIFLSYWDSEGLKDNTE